MSFIKDPDEVLDFKIDWADWLGDDTISTSSWDVPASLAQENVSNTTTATTIWLSGGTTGETYEVTNTIVTAGGRTGDRVLYVTVRETLLAVSDFSAVRAALDVSLDTTLLPNSVLSLDIYIGAAQRELGRIIDLDALTDEQRTAARTALVYLTAARVAPAVPQIVSEEREGHSYQRQGIDWGVRADELRQEAHTELDAIELETVGDVQPIMFTTASGGRGKLYNG